MDQEQRQEDPVSVDTGSLTVEDIHSERLRRERKWYLSKDGFLDFVRDSGAAPDAQWEPHGIGAEGILNWNGEEDPESPGRMLYKYKMVLWPRGAFKSSVFDIGYAAWLIANNPDIRILVCSETGKQAKTFVDKCKEIIDSEWYRERFGVHRGKEWRQGSFVSALRTRPEIKEPTLQATGVGEVRTGMHWDFIIPDDVCSQENTKTPDSRETLWYWFGETIAQLDPGGCLLVIGTLHHYDDLYRRIQKDSKMKARFEFSINAWCDPISEEPEVDRGEKLFFPGNLTRRFVANQQAFMPPRLFACFYLNRPQAGSDQLFKPEYFHVLNENDIPEAVWTYIFTDFAFIAEEKKKGKADRTAFWVVSIDTNRYAYVRDFYVGRWKPSDSVRVVCDLWDRYQHLNMKGIVMEDTTHKEVLASLFDEIRRNTFVRPRIIAIGGRSQEIKDLRIEAIEPKFRRGEFYFSNELKAQHIRKWKPMIDEMTEWPDSSHDDIPDAISDIDKLDKNGKFYCPAPHAGWRPPRITPHQPSLIDGRYNKDYGYPAREFTKANNSGAQRGPDLWRQLSKSGAADAQTSRSQSIFQRPAQPPTRPDGF
jgi:predicted phage terminase large subunit-like protein